MPAVTVPGLLLLTLAAAAQDRPRVYAPPMLERDDAPAADVRELLPLHGNVTIGVATDDVFRGVELNPSADGAHAQLSARLTLGDDGLGPRPFAGVVADAAGDGGFALQSLRPAAGVEVVGEWGTVALGHRSLLFPDGGLDTNEVFVESAVSEYYSLFQPFGLVAYDYDRYDGLYAEAGLRVALAKPTDNLGLNIEVVTGYAQDYGLLAGPDGDDTGFAHYRLGVSARYGLNELLNLPRDRGEWSVLGEIGYVDGLDGRLRADTQVFGGVSLSVRF